MTFVLYPSENITIAQVGIERKETNDGLNLVMTQSYDNVSQDIKGRLSWFKSAQFNKSHTGILAQW